MTSYLQRVYVTLIPSGVSLQFVFFVSFCFCFFSFLFKTTFKTHRMPQTMTGLQDKISQLSC